MRVLITGATGFIGKSCVSKFMVSGWDVIATGRNEDLWNKGGISGVPFIRCDLSDINESSKLPKTADCIVHCAALSSPWGSRSMFELSNVVALKNVLSCVRSARFVHMSSSAVNFSYEPRPNEIESTQSLTPAPNHYVRTKRIAEELVMQSGQPYVILRPHAVIGLCDTSIVPRVMRLAKSGVLPLIGPDTKLDLTHVSDLVEAVYLAAMVPRAENDCYNISGGSPISRYAAFEALFRAVDKKVRYVEIPYPAALCAAKTMEFLSHLLTFGLWEPPITKFSASEVAHEVTLNITKAKSQLGYAPQCNILDELYRIGQLWK